MPYIYRCWVPYNACLLPGLLYGLGADSYHCIYMVSCWVGWVSCLLVVSLSKFLPGFLGWMEQVT